MQSNGTLEERDERYQEYHKTNLEEDCDSYEYYAIRHRSVSPLSEKQDGIRDEGKAEGEDEGKGEEGEGLLEEGINVFRETNDKHLGIENGEFKQKVARREYSPSPWEEADASETRESSDYGRASNHTFDVTIIDHDDRCDLEKTLFGDITKESAARQMMVGGVTGWIAALGFRTGIHRMPVIIISSLLMLQLAVYTKVVKVDWTRVQRVVTMANLTIEQTIEDFDRRRKHWGYSHHAKQFYRDNKFLGLGFGTIFLLDIAAGRK